jgi:hypothetical protein
MNGGGKWKERFCKEGREDGRIRRREVRDESISII